MMRPGTQAPSLSVKSLNKTQWTLNEKTPKDFSLVVFYRGTHCPMCRSYLEDLSQHLNSLKDLGVTEVIAISGDTQEKALEAQRIWNVGNLNIGFGQSFKSMSEWGLFISESIKDNEPKYFGEPGLFLIDSDNKLFYCNTNSMTFGRPHFKDLVKGLKMIKKANEPRRGNVPYNKLNKLENKAQRDLVNWDSESEMLDNHIITDPSRERSLYKNSS